MKHMQVFFSGYQGWSSVVITDFKHKQEEHLSAHYIKD